MKIALIAGTRPEVVKLAPLHAALGARAGVETVWISTEQQASLNAQTLEVLDVRPDLRLPPPSPERGLGGRFAQIMDRLDDVLDRVGPDMVVVQGDTSTTAAGAMAAFARRIPIGHVEAGLRTFDLDRPFPEEGWRRVVGQLASVHFAPTIEARDNLLRAGVRPAMIHVTGNTGVDSVRLMGERVEAAPPPAPGRRRVLVTLHRRENWDDGLDQVLRALIALRDQVEDIDILFVAHANPMLRARVAAYLDDQPRIEVTGPLDYARFIAHLKTAHLVLSDSGGVQEEAPVFGVPVLILRESTERMEAVTAGVARLVGTQEQAVVQAAARLLTDEAERQTMVRAVSPFGDGHAAERIADILTGAAVRARPAPPPLLKVG